MSFPFSPIYVGVRMYVFFCYLMSYDSLPFIYFDALSITDLSSENPSSWLLCPLTDISSWFLEHFLIFCSTLCLCTLSVCFALVSSLGGDAISGDAWDTTTCGKSSQTFSPRSQCCGWTGPCDFKIAKCTSVMIYIRELWKRQGLLLTGPGMPGVTQ